MRDKQFYINSIKMDLFRVVTATGDVSKELPTQSIVEFMEHVRKIWDSVELTNRENALKQEFLQLQDQLPQIKDTPSRLKWAEKILTIRCRL
jgi:hypothetical protein